MEAKFLRETVVSQHQFLELGLNKFLREPFVLNCESNSSVMVVSSDKLIFKLLGTKYFNTNREFVVNTLTKRIKTESVIFLKQSVQCSSFVMLTLTHCNYCGVNNNIHLVFVSLFHSVNISFYVFIHPSAFNL